MYIFLNFNLEFIDENNLYVLLKIVLFAMIGLLIRKSIQVKSFLKLKLYEKYTEVNSNNQYQLFLFFLGGLIIIIEIILEIYKIRPQSLLLTNCAIGGFLLLVYFISKKNEYLYKNIRQFFIIIYFICFTYIIKNIIFHQDDIVPIIAYIVCFSAFFIIKPIKYYWYLCVLNFSFLLVCYLFEILIFKNITILFIYTTVIMIVCHIQYVTIVNENNKFQFADQILNKGNSLTIAFNNLGEVTFCSESILEILGYDVKEVLGLNFWTLTHSNPFLELENYSQSEKKLHTQVLQCKNGDYKHIQWKDKKFSNNLTISIGQDVTSEVIIQNRYKNLIENATDIIFETDLNGKYVFINKHSEKVLGYTLEELYTMHFKDLIRNDYKKRVLDYYNVCILENNFNTLIFPVKNKLNETVWLSQNITPKVNAFNQTIGYTAIARDVTLLKQIQLDTDRKDKKNRKYNNFIKALSAESYDKKNNFETILPYILENISRNIYANRVGFWEYKNDYIQCQKEYILNSKTFNSGQILLRKDFPNYFEKIQNAQHIVISNLHADNLSKELIESYSKNNKTISLLDTPIFLNGKLIGVLCIETTSKIKFWDNEDIIFARSISDFIAIAIETTQRVQAENTLAYKNEMLSIIAYNTTQFLNNKNTDEIFKNILNSFGAFINVDKLSFFENNPNKDVFFQKYRWLKISNSLAEPNENLQNVSYGILNDILDNFKEKKFYASIVSQIKSEPLRTFLENLEIKSVLFFPIYINYSLCGMLVFDDSTQERIWTEDEISILKILVNNLSAAVERNENEKIILESEKRFRLLADNIPGTIYLSNYDEKWTKFYLNDEILNLTGYPKEEFLNSNIYFADLIHPDDLPKLKKEINFAVSNKQKIHSEYRIIHKNGTIIWVEEFGDAIYNEDKIDYIEGIFIDITQKKLADDAIKAKEYAEGASKAKSEFLANMTHEIKTPLNGIIGFTNLIKNTKLEEIQKNYINTINESANSLMEIIDDILDFSKIESGKLILDIKKYNIGELANQVIELIKYDSNIRKLKIHYHKDKAVPTFAHFDKIRLKQILVNLLSNAVKFTPKGSITLSIELLEKISETSSKLRFSVTDTGIGIKQEYQNIIFDAFSQGDNSTTRRFGGTGLGLTISNKLLSLMQSKLQLKSKVNVGSTFFFDIEFETSNKTENKIDFVDIEKDEKVEKNNFGQENYKILIVEDNKINMLLVKTLVKQIIPNSSIFLANNGKEAVDKFEIIMPDLILMDVQMPEMNGYEATNAIRKKDKGKHIPIIAITAGTVIGEKEKCLASGMNDYTAKPILKDTLEKIISKWL